ncbi:hypothetical protein, partial [Cecembia lonarensis]|uniref:hypothetical protein n=1 Tax=Cecembia lonarensis TaxID=645110 RepID=UPI001EE66DCE
FKGFIKNNIVVGLSWLSWFRHGQVSRAFKKLSSFASVKDFSLSFLCPFGQAGLPVRSGGERREKSKRRCAWLLYTEIHRRTER